MSERVILSAVDGLLMGAAAPIAWWTSRTFPIGPPRRIRNGAVHVVMALLVAGIWIFGLELAVTLISGRSRELTVGSMYLG